MADIFWSRSVLYCCSCKLASPLSTLYFCRYCVEMRCQLCVYTETDSYYCPNCLENMPSAEAKVKKNRCANCYECPSCGNALSTRATAVAIPSENPEEKATAKKVFYLACGFCRWSTRDVQIPDKSNANSGWPEPENPASQRMNVLVEYYKKLAAKEQHDREKLKLKKKSYMHITSSSFALKTGNLALMKKRSSLSLMRSLSLNRGAGIEEDIKFDERSKSTEQPPRQELYSEVVKLEKSSSLFQMLSQPDFQFSQTSDFYPRHKYLIAKQSQRCRQCEHNLLKPEFNPNSTKYKIQFFALNYVPQIQVSNVDDFSFQKKSRVTLSLKNPLDYPISVTLRSAPMLNSKDDVFEEVPEKGTQEINEKVEMNKSGSISLGSSDRGLTKAQKIPVDNNGDNCILDDTVEVLLPSGPLELAARDDAAEYDESEVTTAKYEDDPSVIALRQANKLWFYIDVIPLRKSGDVEFSLILQYDYQTIVSSKKKIGVSDENQEEPEIKTVPLEHRVHLRLGQILIQK
ncbi:dynactin subunit 4-like isoform X2 [Xenia sp. Carnegie-2017]|uniref:dynactin subunit 4-like isoform X2 n=1 Tax=Xenia sp. Carnegie-2017 TaxID=2897299 RepID=UPI001F04D893|nr:dynactin subunit 4-like isoform X2 [Xenia sp. Carnegie-2017]